MQAPFNYYLDAARYCRQMGISHTCIVKVAQSSFVVETP